MVLEPQISSQKSQFQWPLNEKTPGFFYCPRDIVWFVHLLLRFPIYRITHSESFMVPQMVNVNFIPTSPRPHPYRMSRFLPPHFFVRAVWKNLSFPLSLKMDSLMVHLLWTLIHRGWGGRDQNKNGTSFPQVLHWNNHRQQIQLAGGILVGGVKPGRGWGGSWFLLGMCRWPLRTCTHYTGGLFCDQK